MEKLTYDELLEKLKGDMDHVDTLAHYGLGKLNVPEDFEPLSEDASYGERKARSLSYAKSVGYGNVVEIDSYGGMDLGSEWYVIYHFEDHGVYMRVDGWYQSHHGVEFYEGWDGCSNVAPKKKTITVYEQI